jgi:hypothetical protein
LSSHVPVPPDKDFEAGMIGQAPKPLLPRPEVATEEDLVIGEAAVPATAALSRLPAVVVVVVSGLTNHTT